MKKDMTLPELISHLNELNTHCPFVIRENDVRGVHGVAAFITADISEHYTHNQLANKAGMNEFHLRRVFKKVYGRTIHAFLTDERMQYAYREILQTQKPIKEIMLECGYRKGGHFSKLFKRYFNGLPKLMREHTQIEESSVFI